MQGIIFDPQSHNKQLAIQQSNHSPKMSFETNIEKSWIGKLRAEATRSAEGQNTCVKVYTGHLDGILEFIETCTDMVLLAKLGDIVLWHCTILMLACGDHKDKHCDNPACYFRDFSPTEHKYGSVENKRYEILHKFADYNMYCSRIICTGSTVESVLELSQTLQRIPTFEETLRTHRPVTGDEDYELYISKSDIEKCTSAWGQEAFKKWMDNMIRTSTQTNWMRKVVATRPKLQQNPSATTDSE